ncbi:Ni2+-Co2+ transporter transition metal uptake transporter [Hypoxylon sp. FL1284]|nr:Ni2+-Co2+ transporter transition metal uptake transporter [Hypoxylon sp. FL1284]
MPFSRRLPRLPPLSALLPASARDRLKTLPAPVVRIIGALLLANAAAWVAAGAVLRHYHDVDPGRQLAGPAVLSYTLGLRHALDADHISAIDLTTRRLALTGQRPVTVGTFFSLGHSTVVIVTCIVVAATSGALSDRFEGFRRVGGVVGTSVSAAFLIILCLANGWVLYRSIRRLRALLREPDPHRPADEDEEGGGSSGDEEGGRRGEDGAVVNLQLEGAGFLAGVFRKLFRVIDRPWKMYPLGILFGLGFDTSSEIAILGIASIQGSQGTSLWAILIFPLLFTAGMCLLDTSDGALMMALYTSKAFARDAVALLYYSIVLTGVTVAASAFVGVVQVLSLVEATAGPDEDAGEDGGPFWDGLDALQDRFDVVGGAICGLFLVAGVASAVAYGPWRRRMERRRRRRRREAAVTSPSDERVLPDAGEADYRDSV